MSIRAFIAIELTQDIKDKLSKIQDELRKSNADVKWVEPKNIHLTLKFLGNTDEGTIEEIKKILRNLSEKYKSFFIELSGIGVFPKISSPRVIWIGIEKGKLKLSEIFLELEEQLNKLGFKKEEREFFPHITIGRLKSNLNRIELIKKIKMSSLPKLEFFVNKIALFKSTLTPEGPIYEALFQVNLK